jgi:hypothetical protein
VIGGNHIGEGTATRRMRRRRFLQTQHSLQSPSGDLPVFLVSPDRATRLWDETETSTEDFRARGNRLLSAWRLSVAEKAEQLKSATSSIWLNRSALRPRWKRPTIGEGVIRLALIALVVPLAITAGFQRAERPAEKVIEAQATPPPAPTFDLETRLAFARPLSDRLLSHAIEQSLDKPVSEPSMPPAPTERKESQGDALPNGNPGSVTQLVMDDRIWSLPFESRSFMPAELPTSPEGSFLAEIGVSQFIDSAPDHARVAETAEAPPVSLQREKPIKAVRRKKSLAQKARPPQTNQMTASAPQAVIVQQEPNLPPPPILFFLGAPPPAPASVQVQQAPPVPQAPAAPAPSSNSAWAPNSLSDAVKNAY